MNTKALLAVGVAASVSAAASADFVDFSGVVSDLGGGVSAIDIYANFSESGNVFLNIFNSNVDNGGAGFQHDDFTTLSGGDGSWLPSQSADVAGLNSLFDSYVNAGYGDLGAANSTSLDPNFLDNGDGLGPFMPATAGWFNGNPDNVIAGDSINVGHWVMASSDVAAFVFEGSIGWKASAETTTVQFGQGSWAVPAPGALALLGLGGLISRRRRTH
jgi:MYXO-CTERM domain-containing protein